jgi:pyruvate/2-oxoglutarate dehydrogenase complex dihydrolipoamide acyltransferase (E2) component
MKCPLSVDHHVVDGAQAERFLQEFKKLMENPSSRLSEDSG